MLFSSISKRKLCLALLVLPMLAGAVETKLSGEFWGRWINETAKKKDASGNYQDKMVNNYLSLERGYLGLETKFSEMTKARFTIDIFTTDKTHEYIQDSLQTALPVEPITSHKQIWQR
jgi:hypothetical protein